ncbi:MAG: protein translocase subunit SecD, partial [Gammaproteobacteria bacterium]
MTVSWRWLALAVLTPLGILYALPNLYPPAPAVQVGWASPDVNIEGLRQEINEQLAQADIPLLSLESESQSLLTTFADSEQQLHAQKVLQNYFSGRAEVALNLADRTPGWLAQLGASAMKLGLDLRGGVYFLMEIDRASLLNDRLNARVPEIKRHLRDNRIRWRNLEVKQGQLYIEAARAEDRPLLQKLVTGEFTDLVRPEAQLASQGLYFVFTEPAVTEMLDSALKQNLSALRNRIDSLGVSEPVVRQEGVGRIAIELPGIQDTAAARRIIGRTATLEFRLEAEGDTPLSRREVFNFKDSTQGAAVLLNTVVTTGEHVVSARSSFDENGLA